jgi:hypothetical protein
MDQFDRLVDEAARQMVQHEPPDALISAVMERVNGGPTVSGHGRLLWSGFAAATAIAGLVIITIPTRTPEPVSQPPAAVSAPQVSRQPVLRDAGAAAQTTLGETRRPRSMKGSSSQEALEGINPPDPVQAIAVSSISISQIEPPEQIVGEPSTYNRLLRRTTDREENDETPTCLAHF